MRFQEFPVLGILVLPPLFCILKMHLNIHVATWM